MDNRPPPYPTAELQMPMPSSPPIGFMTGGSTLDPSKTGMMPGTMPITVPPSTVQGNWSAHNTTYQPGLQLFTHLDRIIVKKVHRIPGAIVTEHDRRFDILDSSYNHIFSVYEESTVFEQCCLGNNRSCSFRICDRNMTEVFRVNRPAQCISFFCNLQEAYISVGGLPFGKVSQNFNLVRDSYSIFNQHGRETLLVKGPICRCPLQNKYSIKNAESEITTGHIYCVTKSCLRQILEIDFSYEIMFPQTLALESKVGVIAAALIINMEHYDTAGGGCC